MLINVSPVNPETRVPHPSRGDVAIILSGGGARAAYQVGVLRGLSRHFPRARPLILAGESAGAINAAYLAAHPGTLPEAVEDLARLWSQLTADEIFRVGALSLARNVLRWGTRLMSGGAAIAPEARGLLDTAPLRALLERSFAPADGELVGIAKNLDRGLLKAIALTTINYSTGQTVTWVQGGRIRDWERPLRRSVGTRLTIDHVLARLAAGCEACLPRGLRFFVRGLGAHETSRPALLSLVMFMPEYLQPLMRIGESDVEARLDEVAAFLTD